MSLWKYLSQHNPWYKMTGLQVVKHADDTDREFIEDLLPWSKHVQSKFKSYK